jgi:hypothetical protein
MDGVTLAVAYVRKLGASATPPVVEGDVAKGKAIFAIRNCATCHDLGYGPNLASIGARRTAASLRESVTDPAAEVAGRIADVLVPGKKGLERGAVKYDALIAGLAHHIDARWLVTSNVRDLKTCLDAINSNVKVVNPVESFTRQGVLVQLMRPPMPAPPPAPATADAVDDPVE